MKALESWGIAIAILGAVIAILVAWQALPPDQKNRYRTPLRVSLIVSGLGAIMQIVAILNA